MLDIKEVQEKTEEMENVRIKEEIDCIEKYIKNEAYKGNNQCDYYFQYLENEKLIKKVKKYFKQLGFKCSTKAFIWGCSVRYTITISW